MYANGKLQQSERVTAAEFRKICAPGKAPSKMRNVKTVVDGERFDSKGEAARYQELKLMERAGLIRDLKRQVEFVLQAPFRTEWGESVRAIKMRIDFTYQEKNAQCEWYTIAEDFKGRRNAAPSWNVRAKLFQHQHSMKLPFQGCKIGGVIRLRISGPGGTTK